MSDHDHSLKPYLLVLTALFVLTALTVLAANFDFGGSINDLVALAIALVKASLVVTVFMHVRGATRVIKLAAAGGFIWLAIFFVIIFCDYMTRAFHWAPQIPGAH